MNWQLFFSVYALVFIAELPDKTAFATLLLATRSRPAPVFAGVALAFFVQTAIAVLFGSLIAMAPPNIVHLFAGLMFLYFAIQMWRSHRKEEEKIDHDIRTHTPLNTFSFWSSAQSAFVVIFIAEWGDLTQIMTGSLVAKYPGDKPTVFVAALLALWSVTLLAVILGQNAKRFINPKAIKKYGAALFALIGIYFVITALRQLAG
jgi:putative Ca2+/H+ antiporter (TMEM165/GDT1 family)